MKNKGEKNITLYLTIVERKSEREQLDWSSKLCWFSENRKKNHSNYHGHDFELHLVFLKVVFRNALKRWNLLTASEKYDFRTAFISILTLLDCFKQRKNTTCYWNWILHISLKIAFIIFFYSAYKRIQTFLDLKRIIIKHVLYWL